MTEEELRREIFRAAGRSVEGRQPPFVEMVLERHPDQPFDYGERRGGELVEAFGEPDKVYRPALGAPFVEVWCHRIGDQRAADAESEGWLYVTNGMSDFPQIAADGAERRTELAAATRRRTALAVDLLHTLAVSPFERGTAIEIPVARALTKPRYVGFEHVVLLEPPSRFSLQIDLGESAVDLVFVTALAAAEFERASRQPVDEWLEEMSGQAGFWWLDERFGLEPVLVEESGEMPRVGGLGCLEEATDSPCPQCGGELAEADPMDSTEAMLVCRRCGWTAMASAVEFTRPYQWAAERFRQVFGVEPVEIDALPDGGAVIVRLKLPGEKPIIVELKNAALDINREPDPLAALEAKLARVEEYLETGSRAG